MQLYRIAFAEMFGGEPPMPGPMSGRTDRAIVLEVLTLAGVPEPRRQVGAFQAVMAAHAPELAGLLSERRIPPPGAPAPPAPPAAGAGRRGPLGLTRHLDLDIGAYGDLHEVRSELGGPARRRAALAYGTDFGGKATVLVGDTPHDIEAALVTGARAVGVATGGFTVAELASAGAHAVLPDLTDTGRVLVAILDQPAA